MGHATQHPHKCETCPRTTRSTKWRDIRAHDAGWFFTKDGKVYCPDHVPAWVEQWRETQTQKGNLMPTIHNAPPVPEGTGEDFPKMKDQVGRIVILAPTAHEQITSEQYGTSDTIKCVTMVFNEKTQKVEDLGTMNVFWKKMKAQLEPAIGSDAYVIGRIMPTGKSYALQPVSAEDEKAISKQLLD